MLSMPNIDVFTRYPYNGTETLVAHMTARLIFVATIFTFAVASRLCHEAAALMGGSLYEENLPISGCRHVATNHLYMVT